VSLPQTPFFDKQQLNADNHRMRLNLMQRVAICGGLLVLGVIAGWWMRSESLNDDYQPYAPRHRPNSVPRYALWVGGQDGGSYIDCHPNVASDYDDCTIYNDWSGDVEASGHFILKGLNRAAHTTELKYSFFDGHAIYLDLPAVDGRIPSLVQANR
jgi:hypothetical protein